MDPNLGQLPKSGNGRGILLPQNSPHWNKVIGHDSLVNFTRCTVRKKELWPMFAMMGLWAGMFTGACIWSFRKHEIWVDRSKTTPPWEWDRMKDVYYNKYQKLTHFFYDAQAPRHIPELEESMKALEKN